MTAEPRKKEPVKKGAKPDIPHEHKEDDPHVHPDQDRHEPQQDHHEHGNLPKRPGRPGGT